jgi:hypothetical protein
MKKALHITAQFDQPELLNSLVEKLAWKRFVTGYADIAPGKEKLLETSSTETYVSGTLGLGIDQQAAENQINMPFITCFLFTCLKEEDDSYKITWSASLS